MDQPYTRRVSGAIVSLVSLLAGLSCLFFVGSVRADSPYPFRAGTRWVYQVGDGSKKISLVEGWTKVPWKGGPVSAAVVRRTDGTDHLVIAGSGSWWECGPLEPDVQNARCEQPMEFFRWPLAVGQQWVSQDIMLTVAALEPVEVPFQRFPQSYRIAYTPKGSAHPLGEFWVVPGVGRVRLREQDVDYQLTEFSPGEGQDLPEAPAQFLSSLSSEKSPSSERSTAPPGESTATSFSLSWPERLPLASITIYLLVPAVLLLLLLILGLGFFRALSRRALEEELPSSGNVGEQLQLAAALARGGDVSRARERLEQVAREHGQYPDVLHHLALLYKIEGRLEEALETWQRALRMNEAYVEARLNIAQLLLDMGKAGEAVEQFRHVIEMRPSYVDAQVGYGKALLESGDPAGAEQAFRRALEMNPNLKPAEQMLAKCRNLAQERP